MHIDSMLSNPDIGTVALWTGAKYCYKTKQHFHTFFH